MTSLALLTDLYQLTMLYGYWATGKSEQSCCFELAFRKLPFQGGFAVAAGLETALEYLTELRFREADLSYLQSQGLFPEAFLDWLRAFRFQADVLALPEGELVFAGEPLLQVRGRLGEAQLVESALLNILNFQTLIATKAARVALAAQGAPVLEFGLRRAQAINGALSASRAAYLGGCAATSNTLAGRLYGIPIRGTHAHSWVMAFPSELEAFRAYAQLFPDQTTLLVDTYDTLESGLPNAIKVGLELRSRGHQLQGIRLDSGDLAELSTKARARLDEAGLPETKIVASNDLDEYRIGELQAQGARIDVWGVGTNLVTSQDQPALGGVYKLVASEGPEGALEPRIKVSSQPAKITVPGIKQIYRGYDAQGRMVGDLLALEGEAAPPKELSCHHPGPGERQATLRCERWRPLLQPVLRRGERTEPAAPCLESLRERRRQSLASLPEEHQRLASPAPYWVGLSQPLHELRGQLLRQAQGAERS